MRDTILLAIYLIGDAATFVYLIVVDWAHFNWWNWILLIPIDFFLGTIWPIYWVVLVPIFGLLGR